ncbi:MAG TPA: folate-binding protein [Gammaproteobacteria bacterium]|nr:folate-binding protein [Gammaproteobacteria bacterium]HRA42620.1 folate-binding protein [Gammaproteobacteria bacterium]
MRSTTKTTLFDLNPFYGLIAVSGSEAATFLQGQITADIRTITSTQPGFSAYCNAKGRIRALFRIFFHHECYFLQLPVGVLPSALATLKKYARFSKVKLEDVSEQWQRIGICLTHADLKTIDFLDLKDIILLPLPSPEFYKRFELIGLPNIVKPLWDLFLASENSVISDFDAWKYLDIQAGIPEIWPETIEQFLPHSLNLPALGAVSFNKGCYCGQEIVARMEYRANVKHKLFNTTLPDANSIPLPSDKLYAENGSDEIIGTVVTASRTEILGVKSKQ